MKNIVTIYRLNKDRSTLFDVVPLKVKRDWMSDSKDNFAYKCVPLNIANQYGWAVLSPVDFTVTWNSGTEVKDIVVDVQEERYKQRFISHFGESVLTIVLDFIVKTPENYSIYVRGIPNQQKVGITSLDAIVETDWLPFTFTYNFRLNSPGVYTFKKGEPLFCFFPIERATVENFDLVESHIEEDEPFYDDLRNFIEHSEDRDFGSSNRLYFKGKTPTKTFDIKNHTTRVTFNEKCTRPDK